MEHLHPINSPVSATPEGQSVSWADQMDDLEASTITAGSTQRPLL